MAAIRIEFFEDDRLTTNYGQPMYGRLISCHEDSTMTSTVEHVAAPGNASYIAVDADTDCYIEIGNGSQDCTPSRRSKVTAGVMRDFSVRGTDTISYRTVT